MLFDKIYDLLELEEKEIYIERTKKPYINSKELQEEIGSLIEKVKTIDTKGLPRSLFIEGPTGNGKTEIVKNIAIELGCKFHSLEIQKVPIESVIGFPYVSGKEGDSDRKTLLTSPTNLPPSDSQDVWVLFLDEFNKADTEEQASFMNLILNGEIGGSSFYDEKISKSIKYKLPARTVVIGAGNPREQKNVSSLNSVNDRDIATDERWHRRVYYKYDAESWLENFAAKEFKFEEEILPLRIIPIIIQYIYQQYIENGPEYPFLIPKKNSDNSGEAGSTFSPRAWTLASDAILEDAYLHFKNIGLNNISFQEWFYKPETQIKFLQRNVFEFGFLGNEIIDSIIANYIAFLNSMIPVEDLLYYPENYKEKLQKTSNNRGSVVSLLKSILHFILKVEDEVILQDYPSSIAKIIGMLNCSQEDLSMFVFDMYKNLHKQNISYIHTRLVALNQVYRKVSGLILNVNSGDLDSALEVMRGKKN